MKKRSVVLMILFTSIMLLSGCGMYQRTADDVTDDIIDQVSSPRIEQTNTEQTFWTHNGIYMTLLNDFFE